MRVSKRTTGFEADDGSRTRDLRLGKPTLYQLSYVRARAILIPGRPGASAAGGTPRGGKRVECVNVVAIATRITYWAAGRAELPSTEVKRLLAPFPLAALAITAALVALLAYGVFQSEPDDSIDSAVAAGRRPAAPALELPRLGAPGSLSLAQLRGKVVVLNYWASWCPPCRGEAAVLERWHHRITPQGGTVLGVDVLDVDSDARAFMRRYGMTFPVVRDGDGDTGKDFGVTGQPETIVIDRRGRIAATFRTPVRDADFARLLPRLLEERA